MPSISSVRPPRCRSGTPATSYSCASQPRPSSKRPPDRYCRLAMSFATKTVAQGGDQDACCELDMLCAAGGERHRLERREPRGAVEAARSQEVLDNPQG